MSAESSSNRNIKDRSRRKDGRNVESGSVASQIFEIARESREKGDNSIIFIVNEVSNRSGCSKDRVIQELMEAKEDKKIRITESKSYQSVGAYAASPYSLWFWGATAATILSFLFVFGTSGFTIYLRYLFGGVLVLFLPGYSLTTLLYAKRNEIDDLTRTALSIGLSLAIASLVGLVLNYTPFGIRLAPVSVFLCGLTTIVLVAALIRKHSFYKLALGID